MSNPVPTDVVQIGDLVTVQFRGDNGSAKPADIVTASGTVRLGPEGDLMLGLYIVAHTNGNPGPDTICVIERLGAEPPAGTIVADDDGDYWGHLPGIGWCLMGERSREQAYSWAKLNESYATEVVK